MLNGKKAVAVFLSGVLVGSSALAGFAALPAGQKAIQAVLNMDKKIAYQGQNLKDDKGINLNSISYNGLEYVPVNVLEKAKVAVNRGDGSDKTIYIGSTGKELLLNSVKFVDEAKKGFSVYTTSAQELFVGDKAYKYGFVTNGDYRTRTIDDLSENGGFYPVISLSTNKSNFTASGFKGSFYINEDLIIKDRNSSKVPDIKDHLTLIVVSSDADGESVIATEHIVPGEVLNMDIPFTGKNIGFRIGATSPVSACEYSNLKLMVLEPKFIK